METIKENMLIPTTVFDGKRHWNNTDGSVVLDVHDLVCRIFERRHFRESIILRSRATKTFQGKENENLND